MEVAGLGASHWQSLYALYGPLSPELSSILALLGNKRKRSFLIFGNQILYALINPLPRTGASGSVADARLSSRLRSRGVRLARRTTNSAAASPHGRVWPESHHGRWAVNDKPAATALQPMHQPARPAAG